MTIDSAASFVQRHRPPRRPDGVECTQADWHDALFLLTDIAILSDSMGTGSTISQATLATMHYTYRQRVNMLIGLLRSAGLLGRKTGSREYVILGMDKHHQLSCGHPWCKKEWETNHKLLVKPRRKGAGPRARNIGDDLEVAAWAAERHRDDEDEQDRRRTAADQARVERERAERKRQQARDRKQRQRDRESASKVVPIDRGRRGTESA